MLIILGSLWIGMMFFLGGARGREEKKDFKNSRCSKRFRGAKHLSLESEGKIL